MKIITAKAGSRLENTSGKNSKLKITETKPLVSVIMPVYNAVPFLRQAIDSILGQTYKNFELIIIDDCSTDGSWEMIKKYENKFPRRIKIIRTEKNLNRGGDSCANLGIEIAKGKYIARMDADDISVPERIEKQVRFLEKNPDVFLLGSNAFVIDKTGNIMGEKLEPQTSMAIYKSYLRFHPMIHPSTMFRRLIEGQKFFYQIKYNANNDYNTFFKLICQGHKFANLKEKLVYYRIHDSNDTFVNIKGKFLNTLRVRLNMVLSFGYKPTLKDILVSAVQTVTLFFLPEKITKTLYLISKGIIKPQFPNLSLRKYMPFSV